MILYFSSHFLHHSLEQWIPLAQAPGRNVGELFSAGGIPLMSFFVGLEVMIGLVIILILVRRAN